jgi:hypothetical protein
LVLWGIGEGLQSPHPSDLTSEFVVYLTMSISEILMKWHLMFGFFPLLCIEARQLLDSLPLRIACVHQCCHDTPLFQFYRGLGVADDWRI